MTDSAEAVQDAKEEERIPSPASSSPSPTAKRTVPIMNGGGGELSSKVLANKAASRSHVDNFISSHHVGLSLGLSILLAVSGLILILTALGLIFSGPRDLLNILMPDSFERVLFVVLGALLAVTPLFLNGFIFDSLRYERELRIRAQKSTREAQLLQDILTHDIRNYNQVSRMSAELIREELDLKKENSKEMDPLITSLLDSIEGSTQLVERAKMLGRVISDQDQDRHSVNILESIRNSTRLVADAYSERKINAVVKLDSSPIAPLASLDPQRYEIHALADNLLDEVFANLLSNSMRYTEEKEEVFIAIELKRGYDKELKKDCWKVSVADTGRGIPDSLKQSLFSRYLEGAKGSGLGMSIVHALVVGRYGGKIQVKDRVEHDHTKGTLVEIWLPAAPSRS